MIRPAPATPLPVDSWAIWPPREIVPSEAMRQAIIFGSVMASFTVEAFSLDRLRILDYKEIEARFKEFKRLTHFEDIGA